MLNDPIICWLILKIPHNSLPFSLSNNDFFLQVPRIMINLFIIIACLFLPAQCARILAVSSFPGKSHFQMTSTIIKELTYRGHEVTFTLFSFIRRHLNNFLEGDLRDKLSYRRKSIKLYRNFN